MFVNDSEIKIVREEEPKENRTFPTIQIFPAKDSRFFLSTRARTL